VLLERGFKCREAIIQKEWLSGRRKRKGDSMPLSKSGKKVLRNFREEYGDEGERIFYASMAKKKKGSEKWHNNKHYIRG